MPSLPPSPYDSAIDTRGMNARLGAMLRKLAPYVWPSDRADLRRRIYLAFALMLAAKLVTVAVPYAFKWATDAVSAEAQGRATSTGTCQGRTPGWKVAPTRWA